MKLIVGLGNPGTEYANTRHNAGFLALDRYARRLGVDADPVRSKFHGAALDAFARGEKLLLLKPMTYMNRSGLAVGEAVRFHKLDPETDLLVIVDDLALPAGTIRLRAAGSPGGHNGLIDIERLLATRAYPRLRIGIDPKGRAPQSDYVLGRFTEDQWAQVDPALDKACDAVDLWLQHGVDKAMSLANAG
ncbi:MAG: aminoacyl-tRNA hydrolase [Planctomycetota bacterium]